ncbi:MAG: metal ABC transporter ATP-binding protein [Candidatus Bathyarchaeota archaeon]|nr:metal ABC transporter ATP-binding protein [Candidatus Bathyarchaeota archaeon]
MTETGTMRPTSSPILEALNVEVSRNSDIVIENASFSINRGDYVGIVGPNGGGKTTLILALLNFLPHTKGTIRLFGSDIDKFASWEKVAYISQQATNFEKHFPLTVRELVSLGCIRKGNIGRRFEYEDWEAVDESIRFMGLTDVAHRRIGQLSGGQKQRVFVAKALARNPEIIFLDEPVVGVDSATQEKFYKKLSDLNAEKQTTILMVTHDLTSVFCRMSKVLCVNKKVETAQITQELDPNTLLKKAYGEHFHFVFHKHECTGVFERDSR